MVRPAELSDSESLVEFNLALALETEAKRLHADTVRAGVLAALSDPGKGQYFVAADSLPQAALLITKEWSDWHNGDYWWIQSVYVRPTARRRGLFRALYAYVEDAARAANARSLRLYVEDNNVAAQATYRRLGFGDSHYRVLERTL